MEENGLAAQLHNHEDEEEEEEEEEDDALSLSDLPITPIEEINPSSTCRKILPRRSSSEPADFFEFLHTDDSIVMSHAEDIFFCGKLVPFDPHHDEHHLKKRQSFYRRRSESLPDPIIIKPRGRGGVIRTEEEEVIPLIRRKKLRRNFSALSEKSTLIRSNNSSTKSSVKSEISTRSSINSSSKPFTSSASRWLFLIFGFVKPLPEMELSDIKSRQVRRGPTSIFPNFVEAGGGGGGGKRGNNSSPPGRRRRAEGKRRSSSSSSSWGLLSVLSCRNHSSVAVTTPFGCLS